MERAELPKFSSLLYFILLNRKVREFCLLMDLEKRKVEDAKTKALEYENAEMKKTLRAVRKQLSIFDDLVLHPTYQNELEYYPKS